MRAFVGRHQALLGFIACLAIMGGTIGYVAWESAQTHHALCALRGDLKQRIASTTAYLKKHPEGLAGVTPKEIQAGIVNQQRTVDKLNSLSCH